jgi:hypothetical protein
LVGHAFLALFCPAVFFWSDGFMSAYLFGRLRGVPDFDFGMCGGGCPSTRDPM